MARSLSQSCWPLKLDEKPDLMMLGPVYCPLIKLRLVQDTSLAFKCCKCYFISIKFSRLNDRMSCSSVPTSGGWILYHSLQYSTVLWIHLGNPPSSSWSSSSSSSLMLFHSEVENRPSIACFSHTQFLSIQITTLLFFNFFCRTSKTIKTAHLHLQNHRRITRSHQN